MIDRFRKLIEIKTERKRGEFRFIAHNVYISLLKSTNSIEQFEGKYPSIFITKAFFWIALYLSCVSGIIDYVSKAHIDGIYESFQKSSAEINRVIHAQGSENLKLAATAIADYNDKQISKIRHSFERISASTTAYKTLFPFVYGICAAGVAFIFSSLIAGFSNSNTKNLIVKWYLYATTSTMLIGAIFVIPFIQVRAMIAPIYNNLIHPSKYGAPLGCPYCNGDYLKELDEPVRQLKSNVALHLDFFTKELIGLYDVLWYPYFLGIIFSLMLYYASLERFFAHKKYFAAAAIFAIFSNATLVFVFSSIFPLSSNEMADRPPCPSDYCQPWKSR